MNSQRIQLYRMLRQRYGFTALKAYFYATGKLALRGAFH